MKFYIAFSINGTNCFITARKMIPGTAQSVDKVLGNEFSVIPSRRPNYRSEDGFKISYEKLKTKAGKPLKCPIRILRVFNELEKNGWTVDKQKFINHHWRK